MLHEIIEQMKEQLWSDHEREQMVLDNENVIQKQELRLFNQQLQAQAAAL